MKKLLTLVSLAALLLPAAPVSAATTFGSPTVDVNWNVTASGSITLYADYATGATLCGSEATGCGTPAVLTNAGAGTGTCTAAPAAPLGLTGGSAGGQYGVFFGSIAPDLTTNNTECYYKDAVDALISTNDGTGYTLTEQATASTNATGVWLCYAPNGTLPTATATGSAVAAAPSGFTATGAVAACPTGMTQIPTASAATVLNTSATVSSGHAGEDYALVVPALAAAGASQFVVTYTFVGK